LKSFSFWKISMLTAHRLHRRHLAHEVERAERVVDHDLQLVPFVEEPRPALLLLHQRHVAARIRERLVAGGGERFARGVDRRERTLGRGLGGERG